MKKSIYLFLLLPFALAAQTPGAAFTSARERIQQGVQFNDDEKYDEAMREFEKVHPADSLYYLALYESALTSMNQKKYAKGVDFCKKGLAMISPEKRGFYDLMGSCYDYMEKQDSAIWAYNEGLKVYPNYYKYYFEIAVSYAGKKNDSAAIRYLIKANELNNIHPGTHLLLARIAARNGYFVGAYFAHMYAILLDNNSGRALNGLSEFQKVCNNNVEMEKTPYAIPHSANYNQIDELLKARAAQIESYKSKVSLPYTEITKQCQLLSEQFVYDPEDKNFYNAYYGKYFYNAWKKGLFEGGMYQMFSGINDRDIQAIVMKKKGAISAYQDYMINEIVTFRKKIPYIYQGKALEGDRFFTNSGDVEAVGKLVNGNKEGDWYIFSYNGNLKTLAHYENNEPEGRWETFYITGEKNTDGGWKKGKRHGPYTLYWPNGQIKEKGNYDNGTISGEVINYNSNGSISEVTQFNSKGVRHGKYVSYTSYGVKSAEAEYVNGSVQGKVLNFYRNGKKSEEREFKDGYSHGPAKQYFENGKVMSEGSNIAGKRDGYWITYFDNGKKKSEGNYKMGLQVGEWKDYDYKGFLRQTYTMSDAGVLNGTITGYNSKGAIIRTAVYKKGKLKVAQFFDNNGKLLSTTKGGKNYEMKDMYPNGVVDEVGKIEKNQRQGKFVHRWMNNTLGTESEYINDAMDGLYRKYYYNGQVQDEYYYRQGDLDGYFRRYYKHGQLKAEGYYKQGSLVGPYTSYYENGAVKEKFYYMNNEATGYGEFFDNKGRITKRTLYSDIIVTKTELMDTTGKVFQTFGDVTGSGAITTKFFNGSKHEEFTMVNGVKHGPYKRYYPNGVLRETVNYVYGWYEGQYKFYEPNGKLSFMQIYHNDNIDSVEVDYDLEGRKSAERTFYNGNLNGSRRWYYENGQVQADKWYTDGEEDSTTVFYGENGAIGMALYFESGVMMGYAYVDNTGKLGPVRAMPEETGKIAAMYSNGNKAREAEYVHNMLEGTRTAYFTNGKVFTTGVLKNDEFDGKSSEYYIDGKLKEESTLKFGDFHGVRKQYYSNGKLAVETNFYYGEKQGVETWYDQNGKVIATYFYINGNAFAR